MLLPYLRKVIHARSGEALWSPLGGAISSALSLPSESSTDEPRPGEILLYAGPISEPELLIVYGAARFACEAGRLEGNPVLAIEEGLDLLAKLGRDVLWRGAVELRISARR